MHMHEKVDSCNTKFKGTNGYLQEISGTGRVKNKIHIMFDFGTAHFLLFLSHWVIIGYLFQKYTSVGVNRCC